MTERNADISIHSRKNVSGALQNDSLKMISKGKAKKSLSTDKLILETEISQRSDLLDTEKLSNESKKRNGRLKNNSSIDSNLSFLQTSRTRRSESDTRCETSSFDKRIRITSDIDKPSRESKQQENKKTASKLAESNSSIVEISGNARSSELNSTNLPFESRNNHFLSSSRASIFRSIPRSNLINDLNCSNS